MAERCEAQLFVAILTLCVVAQLYLYVF